MKKIAKYLILVLIVIIPVIFLIVLNTRKKRDIFYLEEMMKQNDSVHESTIKIKRKEIDSINVIIKDQKALINEIEKNLKLIQKQKKQADENYKKIQQDIINASDSDDWKWFNSRFPKSE